MPAIMAHNVDNEGKRQKPMPQKSVGFFVHQISGHDLLDLFGNAPTKIDACCLCYVVRGNIKVMVNIKDFNVVTNDFMVLFQGVIIQILEVSDDALVSIEAYSSAFLKQVNFWHIISPIMQHIIKNPVFSLNEEVGNFYRESFDIMKKAASFGASFMTHSIAESALVVAIDMLAGAIRSGMVKGVIIKSSSRDQVIVGEFMKSALENYRSEHKIAFYAHEASLSLSHFCNVISKSTGMTAQHIIMNLIIMDAKIQLKSSDIAVREIAQSLGFTSPTTFNRYFKTYTGMTPNDYRNATTAVNDNLTNTRNV